MRITSYIPNIRGKPIEDINDSLQYIQNVLKRSRSPNVIENDRGRLYHNQWKVILVNKCNIIDLWILQNLSLRTMIISLSILNNRERRVYHSIL